MASPSGDHALLPAPPTDPSSSNPMPGPDSVFHKLFNEKFTSRSVATYENVTAYRGGYFALSNFYVCAITHQDHAFKSVEHAYQYRKCSFLGELERANQIKYFLDTPQQVKRACAGLGSAEWDKIKADEMYKIMRIKLDAVPEYKQALLASNDFIAEAALGDLYWSCGLGPDDVMGRSIDSWPGLNVMGRMHMLLRSELLSSKRQVSTSGNVEAEVRKTPLLDMLSQPGSASRDSRKKSIDVDDRRLALLSPPKVSRDVDNRTGASPHDRVDRAGASSHDIDNRPRDASMSSEMLENIRRGGLRSAEDTADAEAPAAAPTPFQKRFSTANSQQHSAPVKPLLPTPLMSLGSLLPTPDAGSSRPLLPTPASSSMTSGFDRSASPPRYRSRSPTTRFDRSYSPPYRSQRRTPSPGRFGVRSYSPVGGGGGGPVTARGDRIMRFGAND